MVRLTGSCYFHLSARVLVGHEAGGEGFSLSFVGLHWGTHTVCIIVQHL